MQAGFLPLALLALLAPHYARAVGQVGAGSPALVHTAFSAECNLQFNWFSVALFYSHSLAKQPGPITRLLACNQGELAGYNGLSIGPTFVHPNLREHPIVDETGYPSYNKPGSLMFWLNSAQAPPEEFIVFVDADMLIRSPIDALALGAERGVVVSAEYSYLVGTLSGFAERFIRKELVHRQAQVGGFHIIHREDARRVSPKWFQFTKTVRKFAAEFSDEFNAESMHVSGTDLNDRALMEVRHKQARWHSEMYGYVFAAAEEGLQHVVRRDQMLYPGYVPFLNHVPSILHYGADYTVSQLIDDHASTAPPEGANINPTDYYFNKMSHVDFDITSCPDRLPFGEPPQIRALLKSGLSTEPKVRSKRELICIEHARTLIAAMCGYIHIHCEVVSRWPKECHESEGRHEARVRETQQALADVESCVDLSEKCHEWAENGECDSNSGFMMSSCPKVCGTCNGPPAEMLYTAHDQKMGKWSEDPPPLLPPEGAPLDPGHDVFSILKEAGLTLAAVGVEPKAAPAPGVGATADSGGSDENSDENSGGKSGGKSDGTSRDEGESQKSEDAERTAGDQRKHAWLGEGLGNFVEEYEHILALLVGVCILLAAALCLAPRPAVRLKKSFVKSGWLLPTHMGGGPSVDKNV